MSVHQLKDGRWFIHYPKGRNKEYPERTREFFGRGPGAVRKAIIRNLDIGLGSNKEDRGLIFEDLAREYFKGRQHDLAQSTKSDLKRKLDGCLI